MIRVARSTSKKNFADSMRLYDRATGMGLTPQGNRYNAACAAALAGMHEHALERLRADLRDGQTVETLQPASVALA